MKAFVHLSSGTIRSFTDDVFAFGFAIVIAGRVLAYGIDAGSWASQINHLGQEGKTRILSYTKYSTTKKYESQDYSKLQDVLMRVLKKLAREDDLRFRSTDISSNSGEINLLPGGGGSLDSDDGGPTQRGHGHGVGAGAGDGDGKGVNEKGDGKLAGEGKSGPKSEQTAQETDYKGTIRKKSGFNISLSNLPPNPDGTNDRSNFSDGTIIININHPDFKERQDRFRGGSLKVTPRLISYISEVVAIHYKDQFYEKYRKQPDKRTLLFEEFVALACRLDQELQPFGKLFSDQLNEEN